MLWHVAIAMALGAFRFVCPLDVTPKLTYAVRRQDHSAFGGGRRNLKLVKARL